MFKQKFVVVLFAHVSGGRRNAPFAGRHPTVRARTRVIMTQRQDATSRFLLDFSETLQCALKGPVPSPIPDADSAREYFAACVMRRADATRALLDGNGGGKSVFRVEVGQHVLLRPAENSMRPSVGRVSAFWKGKGKGAFVRVCWFYRPEDLSENHVSSAGEDELFETEHFDNVDVEAIAGRCFVSSYSDWVKLVLEEKAGRVARVVDSKEVGEADTEVEEEEPAQSAMEQNQNGEVTAGRDDAESETNSFFWDNYESAPTLYFCRSFYDPNMDVFVPSRFDDEAADPLEELALLRESGARNGDGDDAEFDGGVSDSSSSAESDFSDASDIDVETGTKKRAKKRPRHTLKGGIKLGRERGATQFSLPDDIGGGNADVLPCRDSEKEHVRRFLDEAIRGSAAGSHGGSRCLYISGVPGTGKTATVREIVRDLVGKRVSGSLPPFEVVEVNGMSLPDPNLVYTELYAAITGKRGVAPMHAAQLLEKRFESCGTTGPDGRGGGSKRAVASAREQGQCIILVLDEMDVLVSRKQKVLYDVLEWPARPNSRMAVIGIANTMDLPERMLPKVGSRLGLNRLSYPPYSSKQLIEILNMRVGGAGGDVEFNANAINLCAKKVASVSGDVRRALELCRRAGELALEKSCNVVSPSHILLAVQDVAGASRLTGLTALSEIERLFLVSAVALTRAHGSFSVDATSSIGAICEKAREAAGLHKAMLACGDDGVPETAELEDAGMRLAASRIVFLERHVVPRRSRVVVNISPDDCAFALREDKLACAVLG